MTYIYFLIIIYTNIIILPIICRHVLLLLIFLKIADGLSIPEWIKPYHLATMESISSNISGSIFENTSLLKLLAGKQHILF